MHKRFDVYVYLLYIYAYILYKNRRAGGSHEHNRTFEPGIVYGRSTDSWRPGKNHMIEREVGKLIGADPRKYGALRICSGFTLFTI